MAQTTNRQPLRRRQKSNFVSALPEQQARINKARRRRSASKRRHRFESALSGLRPISRPSLRLGILAGTDWRPSKVISLSLLLCVIAALVWLYSEERWFVFSEDVEFTGLTYLDANELFDLSELNGWSVLWLQPDQVSERLATHPYVVSTDVAVRLPNSVIIAVHEAEPVAIWVTKQGSFWLLEDGSALPAQAELDETLPRIVDGLLDARVLHEPVGTAINANVLESALALMTALPDLNNSVRYDRGVGLNFHLPTDEVWIYWGDGYNMETKLNNLAAMRSLVIDEQETAQIIDVRYLNRPYMR